jgi:FMN phosphatase YigB (HAD superfamily)
MKRQNKSMRIQAVIIDFNRTLYDPDSAELEKEGIEILEYLKSKNYLLYLVARDNPKRRDLIKSLGIEKYFRKILIKQEKSEEDFLECLVDAKLPSKDFVVIGDRIKKEISIGNKLGMMTIWIRKGKFSQEKPGSVTEKPDQIIDKLVDIKDFL